MVKILLGIPCSIVIWLLNSLFTAFVLQNLWNWFVVPALHGPEISFWVMYGLNVIMWVITSKTRSDLDQDSHWDKVTDTLEFGFSPEQRRRLQEKSKEKAEGEFWSAIWDPALTKLVSGGAALVAGWGIHEFLV